MDAERKARLGQRWVCYSCEARFYDLNRPEPICPKCEADQRESPAFEKPKRVRASKAVANKAADKEQTAELEAPDETQETAAEPKKAAGKKKRATAGASEAETKRSRPKGSDDDLETADEGVIDSDIALDDFELIGDSNIEEDSEDD
jgi:uncharacterized protein (TIGR02300 family)